VGWEKQQNGLIRMRQERFDFLLDIIAPRFFQRYFDSLNIAVERAKYSDKLD
jgi:hypothetical protein